MNIYQKNGVWYAPKWCHPQTGVTHPAHSLQTREKTEAQQKWALEQAGAAGAALIHLPQRKASAPKLERAFVDYLVHKRLAVATATLESYKGHGRAILATLGDWDLDALAGPVGAAALQQWVDGECERLGRTHTVVKRLEALLKPAVRLALAKGKIDREPLWPQVRNDYKAEGKRQIWVGREQFALLRSHLAERDTIERAAAPAIVVWPQLWADIIVTTGMHDSDVARFCRAHWDREKALWWRVNTKGAEHYAPEWFPCDPYLQATLERADDARRLKPADLWVADELPPQQWMRQRLKWASKRAELLFVPQPIDFRRTCATWLRDAGWEFDEVAKLLGNSTGMVREVYAQVPRARFVAAVAKVAPAQEGLISMARALEDGRKGPRRARTKGVVKSVVSTPTGGT